MPMRLLANCERHPGMLAYMTAPFDLRSSGNALVKLRWACQLATLAMCRVLSEVTALEREATLQHEACLQHLSDAVRVTFKAHQLAGGLHPEGVELFDQVKRLTRYARGSLLYYMESILSVSLGS